MTNPTPGEPGRTAARGSADPPNGLRAFSSPAGKRNGKEMGRTSHGSNDPKTTHRATREAPDEPGAAQTKWRLCGAVVPHTSGTLSARRVGAARGGRQGHRATRRRTAPRERKRKTTEEKTEARGQSPPQHPSQGQPAYRLAALYSLDLGVINEVLGLSFSAAGLRANRLPPNKKGGRIQPPFCWVCSR